MVRSSVFLQYFQKSILEPYCGDEVKVRKVKMRGVVDNKEGKEGMANNLS